MTTKYPCYSSQNKQQYLSDNGFDSITKNSNLNLNKNYSSNATTILKSKNVLIKNQKNQG